MVGAVMTEAELAQNVLDIRRIVPITHVFAFDLGTQQPNFLTKKFDDVILNKSDEGLIQIMVATLQAYFGHCSVLVHSISVGC